MTEAIGGSTPRSRLRRLPELAEYERSGVYEILDAESVCHVGTVVDGLPLVLPTLYVRDEDRLLLHGSRSSRLLSSMVQLPSVCVTVTLVDGLVVARSTFHSTVAYRSAAVFGPARLVEGTERRSALDKLIEGVLPGRTLETRRSTASELRRTKVVEVLIEEASAKISVGPPEDEESDIDGPAWGGVIPYRTLYGPAEPAPDGAVGRGEIPIPPSVRRFIERDR
jgi:nitroimidazol reductase NimA-like FMN-containing flavoprotein (pyridoxamine 5'-phosphate oxidase superfamily)